MKITFSEPKTNLKVLRHGGNKIGATETTKLVCEKSAPTGIRTRVTAMGGLHDTPTPSALRKQHFICEVNQHHNYVFHL